MSIVDDLRVSVKRDPTNEFECEDLEFRKSHPAIWEMLSRTRVDDTPRKGASLTVKYRDGGCSLCMSSEAEEVVGWHQGRSLAEALQGLEKRLQARNMDWRARQKGWTKR